VQGRDLFYLVINATCQDNPPAFLGIATHHGDEKSGSESVLATADYLLKQAAIDPVNSLLRRYSVYLLPVMNPDGFEASLRTNANGVDLNRDYSFPGRDDASSFKQQETRLVKLLQDSVQFHAAITYHSGALEVIWPWCYTGDATTDDAFFASAGQRSADAMSFTVYQQSYYDYASQGEYIDYAYWKNRTLAATFEVSLDKTPNADSLTHIVETTWNGTLAWLQAVSQKDSGVASEPPVVQSARPRFPTQTPIDSNGNKLE
jgi:predicted deacylase